jgi:tetratricopeptide (TPR) repeat protein
MITDGENYQLALRLHGEGKYKEAITIARQISEPAFRAGILIDSGTDAGKPQVVSEGVELFEAILNDDRGGISRASLLYNIGNGYSSIYKLRRMRGVKVVAPNDDDLRNAKIAYREAIAETKGNPTSLRTQILVNYGNCLSMLGRSLEAIKAYGEALELEPQNGMAAGDLGCELYWIADITGRYRHHYILAAHDALTKACSPQMHLSYGGLEASRGFRRVLEGLQELIDAHEYGLEPLKQISLPKSKPTTNRCIQFCLKHQLFLNAWVGDQTVMPAISDEIAFGPISTLARDKEIVPELLRVLNEVKEAFTTARYQFYLSLSESKIIDNISSITSYFDFDSDDLHGLYLGLCKSAYMRSFDVLDKVARIVNIYFKIGKRDDYFWHIFAERQSCGETHEIRTVARPAIITTYNPSLYALADLCIDYFESEQVDLKTIDARRNLMTHDYLAVLRKPKASLDARTNEVTASELYRQTLAVLELAKYAILYAISAVHIAEEQKGAPSKTTSIHYQHSIGNTSEAIRKAKRTYRLTSVCATRKPHR